MLVFILKRVVYAIPLVIFISILIFMMVRFLPGDVADILVGGEEGDVDPVIRAEVIKEYGLDKPLITQYGIWAGKALQGDLGQSIHSEKSVTDLIVSKFPKTLLLAICAILVAISIALPAGVIAAVFRRTPVDYTAMTFALAGVSFPNFWLAIMLILLFSLQLRWFPSVTNGDALGSFSTAIPYIVLPSLSLGTRLAGVVTRLTRSSMLDELNQDYVRTARSKGLRHQVVIITHALRNALLPTITVIGLQFGALLGGTVVIEEVFSWPGLGMLLVDSIFARDYPVVQGVILTVAVSFIVVNLIVDILYTWLNPRIRLD